MPTEPPSNAPQFASVSVLDNFFGPGTVTIAAGGTVTWSWGGAALHDVSGSFGSSGLQTSGSFSATFSAPGVYAYSCSLHASVGMRGTVVVE